MQLGYYIHRLDEPLKPDPEKLPQSDQTEGQRQEAKSLPDPVSFTASARTSEEAPRSLIHLST